MSKRSRVPFFSSRPVLSPKMSPYLPTAYSWSCTPRLGRALRRVRLDRVDHDVMDDLRIARLDLHRLDPAILGERRRRRTDRSTSPGPFGVHREVVRRRHLQVGLADEPVAFGPEGQRRRHVGGVALRRAGVDPAHDRSRSRRRSASGRSCSGGCRRSCRDATAASRGWRRAAGSSAPTAALRRRSTSDIGADVPGVMTRLALCLEDRRDVLGEGRRVADCAIADRRLACVGGSSPLTVTFTCALVQQQ